MAICLRAPLTEDEACSILGLRLTAYRRLVSSGKLVCTGSIRDAPPCRKSIPTILDILHHRLCACVQTEIDAGLITGEDIDDIVREFADRIDDGPPVPGGGVDPEGNLYVDTIWLLGRPPTTKASRRLAATLAQTLLQCHKQFEGHRYTLALPNEAIARKQNASQDWQLV